MQDVELSFQSQVRVASVCVSVKKMEERVGDSALAIFIRQLAGGDSLVALVNWDERTEVSMEADFRRVAKWISAPSESVEVLAVSLAGAAKEKALLKPDDDSLLRVSLKPRRAALLLVEGLEAWASG